MLKGMRLPCFFWPCSLSPCIVGKAGQNWEIDGWAAGDIIGVRQSGRQLVIHNFGKDNTEDRSAVFTLR
jgi:hypothetical protein